MWWFKPGGSRVRRFALLLGGLLWVSSCGFSPVYGPSGSGEALAGAVTVSAPSNEVEFDLARALEDRFGPPVTPVYTLDTVLSTRSQRVSITATQDTNRFNLVGQVEWTLVETGSDVLLADGRVEAFSSYSATGTTVATRAAERDAYKRLMNILADRIAIDLNSRSFDDMTKAAETRQETGT